MSTKNADTKANLIRARAVAFKIGKELGFPHPREVPLEDLAMSRGVLVVEGDMKGAEGRLLRKNNSGIIRIRKGSPYEGRRRFTIAHELGHWELHAGCSQFLCDENDMRDYGRSPLEMEANCFAAELLLPTSHFRSACSKKEPSMSLIEAMAVEFQTTLTATAIRFADLTEHKIIVVWYQANLIRWCYSNPKTELPFVVAGKRPPAFSSATLAEHELGDGMDHYEDADWFPQLTWGKDDILEETKRMPSLNAGLTLLWLQ